jgi:iron(III) transport system ATP-binding protein
MVTHDPEEAMLMADRVLVMDVGRIVQDGTPVETYFHPATAFVAALFGPVNRLTGVVAQGRVTTPLGTFEAPGLAEGVRTEVLIRPEGLRLNRPGETFEVRPGDAPGAPGPATHTPVKAVSARSLGRSSFVVLSVPDGNGALLAIEARVPGVFLPTPGEEIAFTVNPSQVHVFPLA